VISITLRAKSAAALLPVESPKPDSSRGQELEEERRLGEETPIPVA